jgi:hypothetical protein
MLEEIHEHFASVYQDKGNNAAGNNAAVCKACESKISEDAESVERQCAHKERGCDMEAHSFLDTIAMSSLACHKVANRILKVRVDGSGCHQPAMVFQRMG